MSEKRVGLRWGASGSRIFCGTIIAFMQTPRATRQRRRTIRLDVAAARDGRHPAGRHAAAADRSRPEHRHEGPHARCGAVGPDLRGCQRAWPCSASCAIARRAGWPRSCSRRRSRCGPMFTLVTLLLIVFRLDGRVGMTLGAPEQLPAWVSGVVRISVSGLLHGQRHRRASWASTAAPGGASAWSSCRSLPSPC